MKTLFFLIIFSTSLFAKENYIVLIPGAASSGDQLWLKGMGLVYDPFHLTKYFKNLKASLKDEGYKVIVCPLKKDRDSRHTVARAHDCLEYLEILQLENNEIDFHIIGHSLGGIVGRQILLKADKELKIKTLTTVSTPHQGSSLANFALDHYKSKGLIGSALKIMEFTPNKKAYLRELKMFKTGSRYLNKILNPKNIPIYSISNFKNFRFFDLLATPSYFLKKELTAIFPDSKVDVRNDGIVPTISMIHGIHLGTIKADHIESGCLLLSRNSSGCEQMLNLLLTHLSKVTR